jgi:hypothetical protein
MKVRAVAVASDRSNAIGTVELECTPHGLVLVHLGVGSFSEDYAPAALTTGTRVLVPWAAIDHADVEGERLFLAFDAALSPHHRLLLANFSSGRAQEPRTIQRQRTIVRVAALAAAGILGLTGAELSRRLLGSGPALATGIALGGAVVVLLVGLLADRLLAYGGQPPDGVREAFEREMDTYLPALERSEAPPAPARFKGFTLAELQGLLPRTTFAIVVTLTASGLAAVLVASRTLSGQPDRRASHQGSRDERRAHRESASDDTLEGEPAAPPAPRPAAKPKAPPASPPASVPSGPGVTLGDPCRCDRADSLLWAAPPPRLSILLLRQRVRPGRGAIEHESLRKRYTDVDVAVVNNGSTELRQITLQVLFFARDSGSSRREQVDSRPLFYEGPLLPGQAIKWGTNAEGTEIEIQGPALGSLGDEGQSAAPSDRFAELLEANHRPVRLHAAMMLAYLSDARAREGILKLREALREDEAPYLDRLLQATAEVRVCRLAVSQNAAGASINGCLFNVTAGPKKELGIKLRGLDAAVASSDPVGNPPNLVAEPVLEVPGELASQTGVTFAARLGPLDSAPVAWEAIADRRDLVR